ncbi:hypothetical protein Z517_11550 [Fonsecaea pedrosoi CBS 271.37]|uniref:Zn(2)-C6 fungal-type domain-containing protein n=1 Tax=Fonsecaea pedrosoi CBS 271.37 TaxID=1442368 RepID=A0A0D2G7Q5_9EURO|nr:uncharacterized protein Z517_11550 [Fonsecaea pedrosoi CBS 271.37]KIW74780.1 hypothetical protein Z517_11550 [Fonsecaea pedrosoi CBS 271.37]
MRCDEGQPCGPCRTVGLECSYAERKATKNEVSLSMILHKLERMDAKIDSLSVPPAPTPTAQPSLPAESPASSILSKTTPILFSARCMLSWPAIRDLLPPSLRAVPDDYALKLEDQRPRLPRPARNQDIDILADFSISTVRELSNAYFTTFNLAHPVLDRKQYFQQTLGNAISGGFGYDADSCIVLMTMALGTFGTRAINECQQQGHETRARPSPVQAPTEPLGLAFYNEARKRNGFLEGDHTIQTCQFYLLAMLYHAQLIRPVDCWSMSMRAAVICLKLWYRPPEADEWTLDMYSRLYWITVMFQTVLTQELTGLAMSQIRDLEDSVPLPKFVSFPPGYPPGQEEEDESFCHYHFLAQIAHRIFLSRVYGSLYYFIPSAHYPNAAVAQELYHQLDQWRSQLPAQLRFDDETPVTGPDPVSEVLVVSLLRSRYFVAHYHLGRPFLYKALHHPTALTEYDQQRCKQALRAILKYSEVTESLLGIKGCMPLAFSWCGQALGQLLLMYAFRHTPALQGFLPEGWERWSERILQALQDLAGLSPAVAKDAEIASILYSTVPS